MNRADIETMIRRPANCGLSIDVIWIDNRDGCRIEFNDVQLTKISQPVEIYGTHSDQQGAQMLRDAAHLLAEKIRNAGDLRAGEIERAWTIEELETKVRLYCVMCGTPRKVSIHTTAFQCANPECRHTVLVKR